MTRVPIPGTGELPPDLKGRKPRVRKQREGRREGKRSKKSLEGGGGGSITRGSGSERRSKSGSGGGGGGSSNSGSKSHRNQPKLMLNSLRQGQMIASATSNRHAVSKIINCQINVPVVYRH